MNPTLQNPLVRGLMGLFVAGTVVFNYAQAETNPNLAKPAAGFSSSQRYIVQFTNPPVALIQAKSGQAKISAQKAINNQQEQFATDLLRVRGITTTPKAAAAPALFYRQYDMVLNGVAVELTDNELRQVRALPYIKSIEPDHPVEANLADSVPLIEADTVWSDYGATGTGIVVSIVDTGIDYNHPDLGGGYGASFKVINGYDFIHEDADPMDDHGHGTHCAGIATANGTTTGVAPDAKLFGVKVLTSSGSGWSTDVIAGIEFSVDPDNNPGTDDGADVISLSLSSRYGTPLSADSQAVNSAVAAGVVCVAAAGNDGPEYRTVGSPGAAEDAITVGATDKSDALAGFSSRGPIYNYFLTKPNVTAPGVAINAPYLSGSYSVRSGTSMATPHVAGAAALLCEVHPTWTVDDVRSALIGTAVDLGYDIAEQGTGRIDVAAAAGAEVVFADSPLDLGILVGETYSGTHTVTLKNTGSVAHNVTLSLDKSYLPIGVSASLDQTDLTINAGTTASVSLSLQAGSDINGPADAPFMFYGYVQASYDTKSIRNLFTFYKEPPDTFEPNNTQGQATPIVVTEERTRIESDGPTRIDPTQPNASDPDYDWYTFQGEAGKTFFAQAMCVSVGSSLEEPDIRLYTSSLSPVYGFDQPTISYIDTRIIFAELPSTGTYYLRIGPGVSYAPTGYYHLYVNYLPEDVDWYDMPLDDFPYPGTIFGKHHINDVAFSDGGANSYATQMIMALNHYDNATGTDTYRLEQDTEPLFMEASRDGNIAASAENFWFSDQTWTYNGTTWTRENTTPSARPARIWDSAMAFDEARGEMILFGGERIVDWSGSTVGDQTWRWDGTSWTQLSPATTPPARSEHQMVYDPDRQVIVMYGSTFNGDTWEWDGTNWTQRADGPDMTNFGMAYDPVRQEMIVIGAPWSFGDVETWRYKNDTWTQLSPATQPPKSTQAGYEMVWDPAGSRVLMITWFPQQTWSWDGTTWTELTTSALYLGDIRVAYDSGRSKIVLVTQPNAHNTSIQYNYTYEWSGSDWVKINTPNAMPQMGQFNLAYDPVQAETVFYGGFYVFNGENSFRMMQTGSSTPIVDEQFLYPDTITGLAVDAAGTSILTSHENGNVLVRDNTGAIQQTINRTYDITLDSLAEAGNAAVFEENGSLLIYDLGTSSVRSGIPSDADQLALSDDASRVVYSNGPTLRLYEWGGSSYSQAWEHELPVDRNDEVTQMDIAGDGSLILVLGRRIVDDEDSLEINQYVINAHDGEIINSVQQLKDSQVVRDFYPLDAKVNEDGTLAASIISGVDKRYPELMAFNPMYPDAVFQLPFHEYPPALDVNGQKVIAGSCSTAYGSYTQNIGSSGRVFYADLSDYDTGKLSSYIINMPQYHNTNELWASYEAFDLNGNGVQNITIWYSKDGAPFTQYPGTFTETPALLDVTTLGGEGEYEFYSIAEDTLSNLEAVPTMPDATVLIDLTAPGMPSVDDGADFTNSASILFSWTAATDVKSSGLDEYDYQLADNPGFSPTLAGGDTVSTSLNYAGTSGTAYYLRVRSKDLAGNTSAWATTDGVLIDQDNPNTPDPPTAAGAYSNTGDVDYDAAEPSDPGSSGIDTLGYEIATDSGFTGVVETGALTPPALTASFTGTEGQEYYCRVMATDNAGNDSGWSGASSAILVDTTNPESAADPQPASVPTGTTLNVTWQSQDIAPSGTASGVDQVSVYWIKDSGSPQLLGTYPTATTQATFDPDANGGDGTYEFYTVATDNAGNAEAVPGTSDTTVDVGATSEIDWPLLDD